MDTVSLFLTLLTGLALGAAIGALWARSRLAGDLSVTLDTVADQAVVREGLERLHDQMRELEHNRSTWQGLFSQQVDEMRRSNDSLRSETAALSGALRKPQVRGQWGELQLRRAVELAGMVDHCDFTEQARFGDGARRPDLLVQLAGGRRVVVDAKVPLEAFLDAAGADDDEHRSAHLQRHVAHVRTHIDGLASKRYWRALGDAPEFVVMYLPAEAFLSAALETDRGLIEYAAAKRVVLATPTTLIALLRTVAHGWMHESLADQAQEILDLGRDLHDRIGVLSGHVDKLGRSLNQAVMAYNQTVGSLESRVLVTARRFEELQIADSTVVVPRQVEALGRTVSPLPVRNAERRGSDIDDDDGRSLAL